MSRPTFTDDEALAFHTGSKPGKLEINPTKPMATQRDLSLAYSPGVAVPVLRIAENPELAWEYTTRGNLVAVISNGTAILGLGDLGALASGQHHRCRLPGALYRIGHAHEGVTRWYRSTSAPRFAFSKQRSITTTR